MMSFIRLLTLTLLLGIEGKRHVLECSGHRGLPPDFHLHLRLSKNGKHDHGYRFKQQPRIEEQFKVFIAPDVHQPLHTGSPQGLTVDVGAEGDVFQRAAEGVGIVKQGPDPDSEIVLIDIQEFDIRDLDKFRLLDHPSGRAGDYPPENEPGNKEQP